MQTSTSSLSLKEQLKETSFLLAFGALKIPMIAFITPRVIANSEERCEIKVPLTWRTKNHLGSMYFGVLCTAADVAGGLLAMRLIQKSGKKINLVFKDFDAKFLKRPTEDVHFISTDGAKVQALVRRALESSDRVDETVSIYAVCPKIDPEERVAEFHLTISLRAARSA